MNVKTRGACYATLSVAVFPRVNNTLNASWNPALSDHSLLETAPKSGQLRLLTMYLQLNTVNSRLLNHRSQWTVRRPSGLNPPNRRSAPPLEFTSSSVVQAMAEKSPKSRVCKDTLGRMHKERTQLETSGCCGPCVTGCVFSEVFFSGTRREVLFQCKVSDWRPRNSGCCLVRNNCRRTGVKAPSFCTCSVLAIV